jgi:hypothetical protein
MSRANPNDGDRLELFPEWQEPVTSRRIFGAGLGSLAVHAIVVATLIVLPDTGGRSKGTIITADFRKAAVPWSPLRSPRLRKGSQQGQSHAAARRKERTEAGSPSALLRARRLPQACGSASAIPAAPDSSRCHGPAASA